MPYQEERFTSRDGLSLYSQCWLPEGPAHGAVVVVHGFSEHSGRYARLAGDLNRQGYAVHGMDLRGHGKSEGSRCFLRSFTQHLDDLDRFLQRVGGKEPGKPLFLFGHSMGGMVLVQWAIQRQPAVAGLVLSAAALKLPAGLFPVLRRLVWLPSLLTPRLRLVRLGSRMLSRDKAVVEDFRRDPLVFHGRIPVRTGAELLAAMRRIDRDMEAVRTPLLILHGTGDRLSDMEGSRQLYRRAAAADKTLRLYDGLYHELLSEPERAEVLADVLAWLDARL
jgi:alpha-beta hydrolase superfamily lysophospholipase